MRMVLYGSMSAARKMLDVKAALLSMNHDVIVPENIASHAQGLHAEDAKEKESLDVFKKYFRQIQNADAILVVNEEKNGQANYIGPNSLIEMAFAHVLEKKIYVLNAIPDGYARDEIEAMHPIELHNHLSVFNI